jgi:hypothetical protein
VVGGRPTLETLEHGLQLHVSLIHEGMVACGGRDRSPPIGERGIPDPGGAERNEALEASLQA